MVITFFTGSYSNTAARSSGLNPISHAHALGMVVLQEYDPFPAVPAAFVMMMTAEKAKELGYEPLDMREPVTAFREKGNEKEKRR